MTPDPNHTFIFDGVILFTIDEKSPQVEAFLNDVSGLISHYQFASLNLSESGTYSIYLDFYDLTSSDKFSPNDSFEEMIKKRHQVELPVDQQRLQDYGSFWQELDQIAIKYSS